MANTMVFLAVVLAVFAAAQADLNCYVGGSSGSNGLVESQSCVGSSYCAISTNTVDGESYIEYSCGGASCTSESSSSSSSFAGLSFAGTKKCCNTANCNTRSLASSSSGASPITFNLFALVALITSVCVYKMF